MFGDRLYIELQRHGIDKERRVEAGLIDLAYAKGLPLVATNEPYFATADDYEAHDALLCIAGGRLIAETDREQLTAGSSLQDPRRNGGAVRRYAGGAGLHGRDRRALRVPPDDAQADPAAVHGRRRHQCADADSDEAAELRRQAEEGLEPTGSGCTACRRARPRKTIARGSPSSSMSSPA